MFMAHHKVMIHMCTKFHLLVNINNDDVMTWTPWPHILRCLIAQHQVIHMCMN